MGTRRSPCLTTAACIGSKSKDAGTPFGVQNAEFAEVIAGDDNRAAYAFLGTPTAGDTRSADFPGIWHLYVAFTYNGGATWTTADATPADPVQRGCIWNQGGSNPCRNLLDFNDITVDKFGRVLVGYADGCTGSCVNDPSQNASSSSGPASAQDALATIARQVGGRAPSTVRNSVRGAEPTKEAASFATVIRQAVSAAVLIATDMMGTRCRICASR